MGNLCSRPSADTFQACEKKCEDTNSDDIGALSSSGLEKLPDMRPCKCEEVSLCNGKQVDDSISTASSVASGFSVSTDSAWKDTQSQNMRCESSVLEPVMEVNEVQAAQAQRLREAIEEESSAAPIDVEQIPDELIGNILATAPEEAPAHGLPFQVTVLGAPRPPCEQERMETACSMGRLGGPEDPEVGNILRTLCGVFKVPVALCALFDRKEIFISDVAGSALSPGEFPWKWTLCAWTLAFAHPMVLVIPDTHKDARFQKNPYVVKENGTRFYCGAPLVSSNGHRMGALAILDVEPRTIDASGCMILNNFAELVMRQLEKQMAQKLQHEDLAQAMSLTIQRSVDSFDQCVMLLDTSSDGWQVMFANAAFTQVTDIDRSEAVGFSMADLFEGKDMSKIPGAANVEAVGTKQSFSIVGAKLKGKSSRRSFILHFRPAGKEFLDSAVHIGIPSFLPKTAGMSPESLYFMTVECLPSKDQLSSSSSKRKMSKSSRSSVGVQSRKNLLKARLKQTRPDELEDLDVGHLLGKGSSGSVYYGHWYGSIVAVKVLNQEAQASLHGVSLEALYSEKLRHPHVVRTLKVCVKQVPPRALTRRSLIHEDSATTQSLDSKTLDSKTLDSQHLLSMDSSHSGHSGAAVVLTRQGSDAESPKLGMRAACTASLEVSANAIGELTSELSSIDPGPAFRQTWMVMEYCDMGCLQDAIDRGYLKLPSNNFTYDEGPNMKAVLATCLEIASALNFLHNKNILHGDLSSWNCLITSDDDSAGRGFTVKVSDFGMCRRLDVNSKIQTRSYGALTHMPPETLSEGIISKATDVYSFGVMMWQMTTGSRPWCGLTHAQILNKVVNDKLKLVWPASTPTDFMKLGSACMATQPEDRPDFASIVEHIKELQNPQVKVCEW